MSEWRKYGKARRDESEPEVVEAFLDGGATVVKHAGKDESDLFIAYRGRWFSVEVKTGNAKRTDTQVKWATGMRAPVYECRNASQAKKLLRLWTAEVLTQVPTIEDDLEADRIARIGSGKDLDKGPG